jgi:hypothetical protein
VLKLACTTQDVIATSCEYKVGNGLGSGKERVLPIAVALALIAEGLALASAILVHNLWLVVICLGGLVIGLYGLYVILHQKKEPRYPLVPPEGKGDVYLPRTDIPRPIHADFRRMREKKRRLEKIKRMIRKKK